MPSGLNGILVPIITPFTQDYEIDEGSVRSHVQYLIENGVHSIILCGRTGEFCLMSLEERKKILEIVLDTAKSKIPVVPTVTAVRTDDAVALARTRQEIPGQAGCSVASSYYFKPTDRELPGYFKDIASIDLPVIAYNIPATVKVNMSPEFIVSLAKDSPNIGYVKEATDDVSRVHEII